MSKCGLALSGPKINSDPAVKFKKNYITVINCIARVSVPNHISLLKGSTVNLHITSTGPK